MECARRREFDVILVESLSRFSRDLADTATLFKVLRFCDVKLFTATDGEITKMHVALKGAMNEEYLDQLGREVRRGNTGRRINHKFSGRAPYGYEYVKDEFDAFGTQIKGLLKINEAQKPSLFRILIEYANGFSPLRIVRGLNGEIPGYEKVVGPTGGKWTVSAIVGARKRGTGIVNNELLIGKLIYNRNRFLRNPDTGKKVSRRNDEEEWIVVDVPEFRIIDDDLWERFKERQKKYSAKYAHHFRDGDPNRTSAIARVATHRHTTLLKDLKCGYCDHRYGVRGNRRYGCCGHREGVCANMRTITRKALETRVFAALFAPLTRPKALDEATRGFIEETKRINREWHSSYEADRKRLKQVERAARETADSMLKHGFTRTLNERLQELDALRDSLERRLATEPPIEIPDAPINVFRQKIARLAKTLARPEDIEEAVEQLQEIIRYVELKPDELSPGSRRRIPIWLHVNLASLLGLAVDDERSSSLSPFVIPA
jgi:site-specific DNA recombinase